ncbi:phosphatase PAP2 family protein [Danxiaibacter flavus]|uniref:Phosphatase PAP2 family protein n=1 Tax=Danxiaibacter flavus TaxID=3049108 RepID=A0ABV3ZKS4_9BACT|nr:phosphatase PAP2 family protein [Chitinophagaceae bacterium DXS]
MNGFLQTLNNLDTWLFLKINNEWTSPFLDSIFPWWRDQNTWVPLYFFLIFLVFYNFGWKSWPWLAAAIVTVVLTDQLSSGFLKDFINRTRPCNDTLLGPYVKLLVPYCPTSGSFTSSHAANHFGQAAFYYFTLKPYLKSWGQLFFIWAATISYGQVYVGVHYPLDVLGGALIGMMLGSGIAGIFNRRIGFPPLKNVTVVSSEKPNIGEFNN